MPGEKTFSFDALGEALRTTALTGNDLERFAASSRIVNYTPVVTSAGGGASMANSVSGWYIALNNLLIFHVDVVMFLGDSPGAAGAWAITPPPQSSIYGPGGGIFGTGSLAGTWAAYRQNTFPFNRAFGHVEANPGGTSIAMHYQSAYPTGTSLYVGGAAPWAWAEFDELHVTAFAARTDGFHP